MQTGIVSLVSVKKYTYITIAGATAERKLKGENITEKRRQKSVLLLMTFNQKFSVRTIWRTLERVIKI